MFRNAWRREELIAAFNVYCRIPFSSIHYTHPKVVDLARIIHRTPSSVALKLVNFARLDPKLQARNISGMSHGGKRDAEIWNEFYGNWEELAYESELAIAGFRGLSIEESAGIELKTVSKEGGTREQIIKARLNQNFFRATVLASYANRCCITGLQNADLLIASHIVPWSADEKNRLNPANGLCLNALHDKAFDRGLITITTDYRIHSSKALLKQHGHPAVASFFLPYEGSPINMPQRFLPDKSFLDYHNKNVFLGS